MDNELATDPEFLWRLLLVQIVYDQLTTNKKGLNFEVVAEIYRKHPLLPHNAPLLSEGAHAETIYRELLAENKVDSSKTEIEQCQIMAEPLYANFHRSLLEQMEKDIVEFEHTYRELEVQEDFPNDERLEVKEK